MSYYLSALLLALCLVPLGLGIFISMRIFNIPDITTDGSYTLGAALTGALLSSDTSIGLCFMTVILSGFFAGCITGIIHTRLRVTPLLAGILVMTALYSINLMIMGKSNIPLIHVAGIFSLLPAVFEENLMRLILLLLFTLLICIGLFLLLKTDFGIAMRATGANEKMVSAQGINPKRMKIIGLGLANALVSLSGFLVAQLQGFSDINMGIGIVILGLGAVMIGESLIPRKMASKLGWRITMVVFGTILFRFILAQALSLGLNPNLLKLTTAIIVLVVVSLPAWRTSTEE